MPKKNRESKHHTPRERRIGFIAEPPVVEEGREKELIDLFDDLVNTVRDADMIDALSKNINIFEYLIHLERVQLGKADLNTKSKIIREIGENFAKISPFYAPFQNAGIIIKHLARRIIDPDNVMSRTPLTRIFKCITDVFSAYLRNSVSNAVKVCENMSFENVAINSGGHLPFLCISKIAGNTRKLRVLVFGRKAVDLAVKLEKELNVTVAPVPAVFSYQLLSTVEAVIFQPETITPGVMLTRAGMAPLLEYKHPRGQLDAVNIGITLSAAYIIVRGLSRLKYSALPVAPYRLSWQEVIDVPVFDLVYLSGIRQPLEVYDEQGKAELNPVKLTRRSAKLIGEIEDMVEARCRLYEV